MSEEKAATSNKALEGAAPGTSPEVINVDFSARWQTLGLESIGEDPTRSASEVKQDHLPLCGGKTVRDFLKIDCHTHILPDNIPDFHNRFGYGEFIKLERTDSCSAKAKMFKGGKFFREVEANCFHAQTRLEECETHGVDVQVLSTVPVMFSYWAKPQDCLALSVFLNDHIIDICNSFPARFVGLGTLPMQAVDLAIAELRRIMIKGMIGIQIGSHINETPLGDPSLFPFYAEAEKLGACIFVHPWDMSGEKKMEKYWLPWLVGMPAETSFAICSLIFSGVFEKFPKLRVMFAHGGGSFPATIGRIEHGWHVRPDLCAVDNKNNPRDYCGKFWLDSLVHDPVMLKVLVDLVGKDKVALGTDYPFPLGELQPGKLVQEATFLTADEKMKILWHNALKWMNRDETQFLGPQGNKNENEDVRK